MLEEHHLEGQMMLHVVTRLFGQQGLGNEPVLHPGQGKNMASLFSWGEKKSPKATKKPKQTMAREGGHIHERWKREGLSSDQVWKNKGMDSQLEKWRVGPHSSFWGTPSAGSFGLSGLVHVCCLHSSKQPESIPTPMSSLDKTVVHPKGRNLNSDNNRNQYIC